MKYTDEDFTRIMHEHGDTVLRICYVRLRSLHDAQDAFQDVFVNLYRAKKKPDEAYLKPWLIKAACNRCTSVLRAKRPTVSLSGAEKGPDISFDDTVERAILSLEAKQRTAIYLFYYEKLKTSQIARILNTTDGNVRVILNRARGQLRDILKEDYFE